MRRNTDKSYIDATERLPAIYGGLGHLIRTNTRLGGFLLVKKSQAHLAALKFKIQNAKFKKKTLKF
ncbi:hypothetical protein DP115_27635 [Brasilonema octagenarum UFV-OR1]|uniref:Uncharacterized protein n=1 Tax=Brasilonema octagenarum UFV-OR1 TaxID=417115 RepID=A0ABX1MES6_9CYAN|nr:hypothetical protein [Brasilonema octagenarum UFV-OR1]